MIYCFLVCFIIDGGARMVQRANIHPFLEIRSFAYDLFRRTFVEEPSQTYLQAVSTTGFIEGFPYSLESEFIQRGMQTVADYLKSNDVMSKKVYDQLHWDYTRLFIGPDRLPAPPWESAYVSDERLLFQEATLRVRYTYAKYGFSANNDQGEPDDHLGLELDYMYQLAHLATERLASDPERFLEIIRDSRSFLKNHLLNWVPALADDIVENAQTDFYKGMATILSGYLKLDLEALDELIHCETFPTKY
jgi:TorA maturation chaperone TorD